MESAPLSAADVGALPDGQGVYQLFWKNQIVYIGKTDSEAGLQKRLARHAWTIQHRQNLRVEDVSFKAVRVYVFTAVDLETQLIAFYKGASTVSWNNSGFGSNDPGRKRELTKPGAFDLRHPLDLDVPIRTDLDGSVPLSKAASALSAAVPYLIRIELAPGEKRKIHPDFYSRVLEMRPGVTTARRLIEQILTALPPGWQATALAGRVVVYQEHRDDYPGNRVIARS